MIKKKRPFAIGGAVNAVKLGHHAGRERRHPGHKDLIRPMPSLASGFRQSMPE